MNVLNSKYVWLHFLCGTFLKTLFDKSTQQKKTSKRTHTHILLKYYGLNHKTKTKHNQPPAELPNILVYDSISGYTSILYRTTRSTFQVDVCIMYTMITSYNILIRHVQHDSISKYTIISCVVC